MVKHHFGLLNGTVAIVIATVSALLTALFYAPIPNSGDTEGLPEEPSKEIVYPDKEHAEELKERIRKKEMILSGLQLPEGKADTYLTYIAMQNDDHQTYSLVGAISGGIHGGNFCTVPADLQGLPIRDIGSSLNDQSGCAYWGLSEGIESIQPLAFSESTITGIQFPSSLEEIGEGAFLRSGLSMAAVGDLQTAPAGFIQTPGCKIGKMAFAEIKANKFAVGEGCTEIGSCAFGWDVKEVWLPESIRICHAFAELQEDGSFAPLAFTKKSITLHFAVDEAAFREIDFGCPLPDGVEVVYHSSYSPQ